MTDYSEAKSFRCKKCGVSSCDVDPACDCQVQKDEYHDCPECGLTLDAELFPTLRACYDHEEDSETLREIAANLDDWSSRQSGTIKMMTERITELEKLLKVKP